jgi:hypothetical protein
MIRSTLFRRSVLLPLAFALVLLSGCGYGTSDRVPVTGNVTFDQAPVDGGVIVFLPEGDAAGAGVRPIKVGGDILAGKYTLEAGKGPLPGKYRVEITWNRKTGRRLPSNDPPHTYDETRQVIPANYNTGSTQVVEIKPGVNTFHFDLKSR